MVSSSSGAFLGVNGSMEGGITDRRSRSTQSGAKASRENTKACDSSTYGRTKLQDRSVYSFGVSRPTWQRQTTIAPARRRAGTSPAGCGSWTTQMSPGCTASTSPALAAIVAS